VKRRLVLIVVVLLAASAAAAWATTPPTAGGALPGSWRQVEADPGGGSVWSGVIANPDDPGERASAVYLPPGFSRAHRYPVLYLLHGLPGSPASYYDSLHLARVVDGLIAAQRVVPMIVVLPAGADRVTAEWAGAWEAYVVRDVVPWVDAHLPTVRSADARVLGGLCAGGFGAMDIGLRHPRLFGGLESLEGYFAPVFLDGPFARATAATLDANDPTLLVRRDAPALHRAGVRFYVSVGGNHADVLRVWSLDFASLLGRLGLPHTLWELPPADKGHFWRSTLPSALEFASSSVARTVRT
jgi:enterochelin esterase-like enzyme